MVRPKAVDRSDAAGYDHAVGESRLDRMMAATPSTRDRYVDLLRGASICAVVFGHWLIAMTYWEGGIIGVRSAVGVTSGLWLGTWLFQVMPIFFFVGGFSNLVTFESFERRGEPTSAFIRTRLWRLLKPSLIFVGVWVPIQIALHLSNTGAPTGPRIWDGTTLLRGMLPPGATLPFGPLWFLAVYAVVLIVSPLLIRLHRRVGWWAPITMAVGTAVADAIAFGSGHWVIRWVNVAFVLFFPHQLGFFYADGRLTKFPRWVFWTMVLGGLALLVVLTTPWVFQLAGDVRFRWFPGIGHYPKSLLGTDVERISNAYPPTMCYLVEAVWTIGAVMLLRPALSRWLERTGPWKLTIGVNSIIMTLFLWHMTAFLLAMLTLWPLGFGHFADTNTAWWAERILWYAVAGAYLAGLVTVFGRFERPRSHASVAV
jgi:fucose 4-O-acetylase-like acetyltransferase